MSATAGAKSAGNRKTMLMNVINAIATTATGKPCSKRDKLWWLLNEGEWTYECAQIKWAWFVVVSFEDESSADWDCVLNKMDVKILTIDQSREEIRTAMYNPITEICKAALSKWLKLSIENL